MAPSESSSSHTGQLPDKLEPKSISINISIPRRKVTLIIITLLLNVLHWSTVVCLFTSFYHIATNPSDTASVPSEVLTLTSGIATMSYIYLHTIISLKQKTWTNQSEHTSTTKRTSYAAVRFAVSLCALWLLTSGWNMIIVARRPLCLSDQPGLQVWEFGTSCRIARLGMAFAMICLVASFALFGVLAVVRRPFEAHLFKHGYEAPVNPLATPAPSSNASPTRHSPGASEKRLYDRRASVSTHRNESFSEVDSLNLSNSPPPPTLYAPSPRRSVGLGIFTSNLAPPPIPPEFVDAPRASSLENLPALLRPSISYRSLTLPPRLSGNVTSPEHNPFLKAPQISASTWRALHPNSPTAMGLASRSYPHLPNPGFSFHQHRYSRSSVSLTKPHRLSSVTHAASVTWSSRSGSTDDSADQRNSAKDTASAMLDGQPLTDPARPQTRGKDHQRTTSAPDTTSGAQPPLHTERMLLGWKPQLASSDTHFSEKSRFGLKPSGILRSTSDNMTRRELEHEPDGSARLMKELPFRKSRSADTLVPLSGIPTSSVPEDVKVEKTRVLHSESRRKRTMTLDEVKNKPLPRIAII